MQYTFKGKNGCFTANIWENESNVVISMNNNDNELIRKEPFKDNNGWYFIHEDEKFYISDWMKIPMNKILEKLKSEKVTTDEFCQAILSEGIENIKFLVPFKINGSLMSFLSKNKAKNVVCHIEERTNREVRQNFRIILVPDSPEKDLINQEDLTMEELISLIKEDFVKVLI